MTHPSKERIRAADAHDLVSVGEPRVQPGGDLVAFVTRTADGDEDYRSTVSLGDAAGGEPEPFATVAGVAEEPRFSPSGDRLAFVAPGVGETDAPQLWVGSVGDGESGETNDGDEPPRQVTDVVGGVSSLAWRPDGTQVAFVQSVTRADRRAGRDCAIPPGFSREPPDPRVVDPDVYRPLDGSDGTRDHVYVVDPGSASDAATAGKESVEPVTDWDDDRGVRGLDWGGGSTLYYTTVPTDGPVPEGTTEFCLRARDVDAGTVETCTRSAGQPEELAATADGRVAFPFRPAERHTLHQFDVHVYDRRDGSTTVLTDALDRTVGDFFSRRIAWGPDETFCYFVTPDEGEMVVRRARWDGSAAPEVVVGRGVHVTGFDVGDDVLVYAASAADHPGDVFCASLDGDRDGDERDDDRRLTQVNEDYLDAHAVAAPEELWFVGPDGDERQGWLLLPPESVRETHEPPHPLVVEIHGGPHSMWTPGGYWWHEYQTLAAAGYAVFWCNPRGSTGYGEDCQAAPAGTWGQPVLADVEAGIDHVCARAAVDADQQFVTGLSFGGYMVAWAVTHTDRFTAAVSESGNHDPATNYGTTDLPGFVESEFGATPWEDPERYQSSSPATFVDRVDTPTLLLHGEDDVRTPVATAEVFYRGLRENGVPTRLVRYPREEHLLFVGEPAHVVDRLERTVRWFDGYRADTDVPPALERGPDDGLSAGVDDPTSG